MLELVLVIVTSLILLTPGNQVGAPFSLGQVSFTFMGTSRGSPLAVVALPADLLVTALPLWLAARRLGSWSIVAGTVGAVVAVVIAVVTYAGLGNSLPFAGFPLPIATAGDRVVNPVVLWVDCVLLGGVAIVGRRLAFG